MNGSKVYEDSYCAVFRDQETFFDCIKSIGRNSFWDVRRSGSLRLSAVKEGSELERELKEE